MRSSSLNRIHHVLGFANTSLLELVECADRKAQHSTIFPKLAFEALVAA